MNRAWLELLADVLHRGDKVSPRGLNTLELLHRTTVVNMRQPVLTLPERKLSYRFMAAEAYWILTGDDTTAGIVPWNEGIAKYSDNGADFYGAYGPRFRSQLDHVVSTLLKDPDSRQAALTLWRPNPPTSKDVPCTVAMAFSLRGNKLHNQVFMRSNDAWLGTPYDVFNFSMAAHLVCCQLNKKWGEVKKTFPDGSKISGNVWAPTIFPGNLYLTAASAHLYEPNYEAARKVLSGPGDVGRPPQPMTPDWLYTDETKLFDHLKGLRDAKPGDPLRWWEVQKDVS